MNTLQFMYVVVALAGMLGCQATPTTPRNKPTAFKPAGESPAAAGAKNSQYAGQKTGYTAPVVESTHAAESKDADDPSALEKLSEGTQGIFTRAGQALSPKSSATSAKSTGGGSSTRKSQAKKQKKPSKPSALYRFFHPEPKQPKTLMEFMEQPRLDP